MLLPAGYDVELACDEKRASEVISARSRIDAAVVAMDAPRASGLSLARKLRMRVGKLIVVTRAEFADRVASVLPEADDVLRQPLDRQELLECVNTGEHVADPPWVILAFEGCRLDWGGRIFVDKAGREIALTRAEFDLLATFARNPGRVLSRDQLRQAVNGRGTGPCDRSIDMLVVRLRRKIEPDPKSPRSIVTVPGLGYKFALKMAHANAAPAPGSASAERRQVTILSGQIAGLAALASRLDPEDLREIICAVRASCEEIVKLHTGSLTKFQGDALLGYFGYPRAHENDAACAVHAGLELIRATAAVGAWLDPASARVAHQDRDGARGDQ
jgi:DNA-binding response OmpR family regulator